MKLVLVDLAAKYIHAALAARYLFQCCVPIFPDTVLLEQTVNQPLDEIIANIYREKPTVVGFSCYIWNIEQVLKICETLKIILPEVILILGGPEVSYDSPLILKQNNFIDFIICGEGEEALPELLLALQDNHDVSSLAGLCLRKDSEIVQNTARNGLSYVPQAYTQLTTQNLNNRIIYYECSRGCPYRCAYCLSGLAGKTRLMNLEQAKRDIEYLAVTLAVPQIKFVDRTFNHNKLFTIEMFDFLKNIPGNTNFHFEIRADLFDSTIIDILKDVVPGRFQFEIGVQSTHPPTLKAINRSHNWDKLAANVRKVKSLGNIHQHLDLIAGLPYEDYLTFSCSFNDVYALEPDMLQLGFLKLIKGSELWQNQLTYHYQSRPYPPYEVLSSQWLSYAETLRLKDIEAVLELYYNSGHFKHTLDYAVDITNGFSFYEQLGDWFRKYNHADVNHSLEKLFKLLYDFFTDCGFNNIEILRELLKFDFLKHFKHRRLPDWMIHVEICNYKQLVSDILNTSNLLDSIGLSWDNKPAREIYKHIHIEQFPFDIVTLVDEKLSKAQTTLVLFDYNEQQPKWCRKATYHRINREL